MPYERSYLVHNFPWPHLRWILFKMPFLGNIQLYSSLLVDGLGYYFGNIRGFLSLFSFFPSTLHIVTLKYLVCRLFAALIQSTSPDRIFSVKTVPFVLHLPQEFPILFWCYGTPLTVWWNCGSISEWCLKIHKIKYLGLQRKLIVLEYGWQNINFKTS